MPIVTYRNTARIGGAFTEVSSAWLSVQLGPKADLTLTLTLTLALILTPMLTLTLTLGTSSLRNELTMPVCELTATATQPRWLVSYFRVCGPADDYSS